MGEYHKSTAAYLLSLHLGGGELQCLCQVRVYVHTCTILTLHACTCNIDLYHIVQVHT